MLQAVLKLGTYNNNNNNNVAKVCNDLQFIIIIGLSVTLEEIPQYEFSAMRSVTLCGGQLVQYMHRISTSSQMISICIFLGSLMISLKFFLHFG